MHVEGDHDVSIAREPEAEVSPQKASCARDERLHVAAPLAVAPVGRRAVIPTA
jgi:hypothetical protein